MSPAELLLRLVVAVVAMGITAAIGVVAAWIFVIGALFTDSTASRIAAAVTAAVVAAATIAAVLGIGYLALTAQFTVALPETSR